MSLDDMPDVLTTLEVAEVLRISESSVRRLVRRGDLKALTLGRSIRFSKAEIRKYLGPDLGSAFSKGFLLGMNDAAAEAAARRLRDQE